MSPTEFDLRAALRDGEGDGPDVDRVLSLGRAQRARRRTQLLSTAAAVVVVAAAATGATVLVHGSDTRGGPVTAQAAGGPSSSAPQVTTNAPKNNATHPTRGTLGVAPNATGAANLGGVSCPAAYPDLTPPAAGTGPLFAGPVTSLIVCAYGPSTAITTTPGRLELSGAQATALATSLENASRRPIYLPCPQPAHLMQNRLAVIGVTADGRALPPVTVTLSEPVCVNQVTSATTARYNWHPPAALEPVLLALTPRNDVQEPVDLPPTGAPRTITGSPAR